MTEPSDFWDAMEEAAEVARSAPAWQKVGININPQNFETYRGHMKDDGTPKEPFGNVVVARKVVSEPGSTVKVTELTLSPEAQAALNIGDAELPPFMPQPGTMEVYGDRRERAEFMAKCFRESPKAFTLHGRCYSGGEIADAIEHATELGRELVAVGGLVLQGQGSSQREDDMTDLEHVEAMRKRSGTVKSTNRLESLLYELIRDHLPAGTVETLVQTAERDNPTPDSPNVFTNGWLANYAKDLAARLRDRRLDGIGERLRAKFDAIEGEWGQRVGDVYLHPKQIDELKVQNLPGWDPCGSVLEKYGALLVGFLWGANVYSSEIVIEGHVAIIPSGWDAKLIDCPACTKL